jgi:hypothetical protein
MGTEERSNGNITFARFMEIISYLIDVLLLLVRKIYPVVFTMSNRFMRYSSVRENGQIGILRDCA